MHIASVRAASLVQQSSYSSAPDRAAVYCDERVCLSVCVCVCVCLSAIISSELHVRSSPISVNVTRGRGSVLLRLVIHYELPVLWMTSYLIIR